MPWGVTNIRHKSKKGTDNVLSVPFLKIIVYEHRRRFLSTFEMTISR